MILALRYMERTGTLRPEVRARFLERIDVGYQRLLGFEVRTEPGGFDWWGQPPANLFLTAYGLMTFRNLSEVHPVDPRLLERIVSWLRSKQQEDGSWCSMGVPQGRTTDMAKGQDFYLTAYVAWGLARAGQPDERALSWLAARHREIQDPYGLALAALAFLCAEPGSPEGQACVDRLRDLQAHDAQGPHWIPEQATGVGARGTTAAIETTALAVQALLLDGRHDALAYAALDRIVAWRGADGRFGSTQSTILALEALCAADAGAPPRTARTVRVLAGEDVVARFALAPGSTDPERLDLPVFDRPLRLVLEGDGRARATLARTSWQPWEGAPGPSGPLRLAVRYPEGRLAVARRAIAEVVIDNTSASQRASVVTLEIGIPPGVSVEPADVRGDGAASVERAETAIVIYLRDLEPGARRRFEIPFTPRYGLDVRTAPSKAYEYYVPEEAATAPPQRVRAGEPR